MSTPPDAPGLRDSPAPVRTRRAHEALSTLECSLREAWLRDHPAIWRPWLRRADEDAELDQGAQAQIHAAALRGRDIGLFRRLTPHPVDRVWAAVTAPEQRAAWAPGIRFEPAPNAPFDIWFGDACEGPAHVSGRLAQFEPPTAIQIGSIRLELQAVDDGCQITFSDVLWFDGKRAKSDFANAVLAGWHRFLDTLEIWLDERRPALDIQEPDYAKVHVDGRDAL